MSLHRRRFYVLHVYLCWGRKKVILKCIKLFEHLAFMKALPFTKSRYHQNPRTRS